MSIFLFHCSICNKEYPSPGQDIKELPSDINLYREEWIKFCNIILSKEENIEPSFFNKEYKLWLKYASFLYTSVCKFPEELDTIKTAKGYVIKCKGECDAILI